MKYVIIIRNIFFYTRLLQELEKIIEVCIPDNVEIILNISTAPEALRVILSRGFRDDDISEAVLDL